MVLELVQLSSVSSLDFVPHTLKNQPNEVWLRIVSFLHASGRAEDTEVVALVVAAVVVVAAAKKSGN